MTTPLFENEFGAIYADRLRLRLYLEMPQASMIGLSRFPPFSESPGFSTRNPLRNQVP